MGFRRGFKSQCERRAVEIRKDLGLSDISPLDARLLAKKLDITVWSEANVKALDDNDRIVLNDIQDDSWSALTLRCNASHLILYKAGVSLARENSVIMHEISHILLGHELSDAMVSEEGALVPKNYNHDQELEADWLAGTLLLPRPTLLYVLRKNMDRKAVLDSYKVSGQMYDWRIRMTGVKNQLTYLRN